MKHNIKNMPMELLVVREFDDNNKDSWITTYQDEYAAADDGIEDVWIFKRSHKAVIKKSVSIKKI